MIKPGFILLLTILTISKSFESPLEAKYSDCKGIIISSEAVKAFKVKMPKEGEQSIKEAEKVLLELENKYAGYQLSIKGITEKSNC